MGEHVDEVDRFKNRIRVDATYYIDIYDRSYRESKQRLVQQIVDEPMQYFFNLEKLEIEGQKSENFTEIP